MRGGRSFEGRGDLVLTKWAGLEGGGEAGGEDGGRGGRAGNLCVKVICIYVPDIQSHGLAS